MAAMLSAFSLSAAELNIYASGLKAGATADDNTVEIQYVLNTPATALEMQFLNDAGDVRATIAITDAALLTKGPHTTTVSLAGVPQGNWAWAMKATGASNPAPDGEEDDPILEQINAANDTTYIFYSPRGVVVDNSFESDHLGWMYVTEAWDGDTDGASAWSKAQKRGLFIYNQLLVYPYEQNQKNIGFLGGVGFSDSKHGMRSPAVDEDGYVFVCDKNVDAGTTGVWMADPANPTNNFVEVLDVTQRGTVFTQAVSAAVEGSGANRVLYVLDYMDGIVRYPIGTAATPYALPGDTVINSLATYNLVNTDCTMKQDGKGGFWLFQNRGQLDGYPMVVHYTAAGEVDFQIVSGMNAELAPASAYRGAGAVSVDGKYMAFAGNKTVNLYEVKFKGNGEIKSVARVLDYEFPNIGTNIDGIAFDVANNIFVVSASAEYLYVFSLPKDDNTFVTPAAARYAIESKSDFGDSVDNINAVKAVKGVYDITGRYLGESAEGLPKGVYIINGEKTVK